MSADRQRGRWRLWALIAIVVASAGAVGAAVASSRGGDRDTITGDLVLTDFDGFPVTPCSGSGGYSDLHAGATVTVKDESGKIVGVGQLQPGRIPDSSAGAQKIKCLFFYAVPVARAVVYQIEVGHRGAVPFDRDRLEADDWKADLSVG